MGYALCVGALHVVGIILLLSALPHQPTLLGLALLAYTFGLRHAFDADHIAAIDNTVRKLVQQRENPSGVGFFFSLGHSSVVCLMAVATALAVHWAERALPQLQNIGGLIGTS
ncbi:MAG: HoxN/HupN/NixA family nickel/cobalt transporter, partial [Alicyclobacillus sp.]|nr:HoxN/HupN/NixA family nickel/cobalt transporter [Alicyclobacillus sp.]